MARTLKESVTRKRKEIDLSTYEGRFAARLRALREKTGLTVAEFSEQSGIPIITLHRWERANRMPSFNDLPTLAENLSVSIRTLMPQK